MAFTQRENFGAIKNNSEPPHPIWDTFAGTVKDASILRDLGPFTSFFDISKGHSSRAREDSGVK